MWMNAELTTAHKNFIYSCYPKTPHKNHFHSYPAYDFI